MTVSVLIHYFTLVAVMWMGAEALLMFQKIVIVFVRITTRYIIAVSIICWGLFAWDITFMFTSMCSLYHSVVPLVPVLIPLSIDRNLVVRVRHNSPEGQYVHHFVLVPLLDLTLSLSVASSITYPYSLVHFWDQSFWYWPSMWSYSSW